MTTATTGDATDADGYSIVVDGESTAVGVSDAVTLTLDAADYSVELTGLDSPCVVDGDNPVSVTVVTDETVSVSFDVVCQSS